MDGQNQSRISNTEWGLVIGALLVIDVAQIGLDLLGIGFFLNWIVDAFVGMFFAFYLQMRGESLADGKRLLGLAVAFVGGEISGGALPLWVLDGIWCWFISKGKKIVTETPGVNKVLAFKQKNNYGSEKGGYRNNEDEQMAA